MVGRYFEGRVDTCFDDQNSSAFRSVFARNSKSGRSAAYAKPPAQDLSPVILPDRVDGEEKAAGKKRNQHGVEVGGSDDDGSRSEAETHCAKARRIAQMGFVESDVQVALEKCGGDEQRAVEVLLT
ncbi:MAG: hypothetical protein BJ554DRAFT_3774 [Olpidium bornovanus]|uniref:UBA domain-containing protein n=1 Tax=Olpidium bornovanus TaxID=278681 RepID=A0A8H7ZNN8_9FUNG|nr:MAG: hypothetical protein BJ554DRAFT_3774 [Olpidium bornovanus]